MKICTICKVKKALECFGNHKAMRDGKNPRCKACVKDINKAYKTANKEKMVAYNREWRKTDKAKVCRAASNKIWIESNKEKYLEKRRNRQNFRAKNDKIFKLKKTLRDRTNAAIKANRATKSQSTSELLGSSVVFVRKWIESQFLPGMTWDNHGDWHIDHIKPCAAFDLTDPEQQRECFNYKNLQPLWAVDNLRKSDRF